MVGSLFMYPILCSLLILLWAWRLYGNACQDFASGHPVWGWIQVLGALAFMGVATVLALMAKAQVTPGEFSP